LIYNMTNLTRHSTRISCLVELSTGVPLVLVPGVVMTLLFGSPLSDGGDQLAQLFGAALIGLGISCWSASAPDARPSSARLGLMLYNLTAALFLIGFAITGAAQGLMAGPAGMLHLVLGLLMLLDQSRSAAQRKPM
jgi:hypothetical protein